MSGKTLGWFKCFFLALLIRYLQGYWENKPNRIICLYNLFIFYKYQQTEVNDFL